MSNHKIISEKNLPESEVQFDIEIDHQTLAKHRTSGLKRLASTVSVPGFRVGHVPENIVVQKVGEQAILKEAAYDAIEEVLPEIIKEKKISSVGEPQISITKLATGNPLVFTLVLSLFPEINLPDYKKIADTENAKKLDVGEVSEKEVNDFIETVRKSFAHSVAPKHEETKEPHEHPLPELNDEFVKKLGNFKDVADFKTKIKENLGHEKTQKAKDKKRLTLVEGILDKTKITVPKALIENELVKMLARFHDDVTRMGMTMPDYLKQIKKTEDDLRKDWRKDAEKHAKLQLVLSSIADKEKIEAPENEVGQEVKHLTDEHKNVDPVRARAYVTMMLINEKVFAFLEDQK